MVKKLLGSIAVAALATTCFTTAFAAGDTAIATWSFEPADYELNSYQGGAFDYTVTDDLGEEQTLEVNVNVGKLHNSGRGSWCQCNAGTAMNIPVKNGSVVTVLAYSGNTFRINGEVFTSTGSPISYTYNGNDDTIQYLSNGGYLSYVSVETPVEPAEYVSDGNINLVYNFMSYEIYSSDETSVATKYLAANGDALDSAEDARYASTISAKLHSKEHGVNPSNLVVPVPGPVKITIGGCNWGGNTAVTDAEGNAVATLSVSGASCFHGDTVGNVVTGYYAGEATTLTLTGGNYWSYVQISSIDASEIPNGSTLTGTITGIEDGDSAILYMVKDNVASSVELTDNSFSVQLTNDEEYSFILRGGDYAYTYSPATVKISEDTEITIAATKIDAVAEIGTRSYNFGNGSDIPQIDKFSFASTGYTAADGLLSLDGDCNYWNTHGLSGKNYTVSIPVAAGTSTVVFKGCAYSGSNTVTDGTNTYTITTASDNGDVEAFTYTGEATTLVYTISGGYLHGVEVTTEEFTGYDATDCTDAVRGELINNGYDPMEALTLEFAALEAKISGSFETVNYTITGDSKEYNGVYNVSGDIDGEGEFALLFLILNAPSDVAVNYTVE